MVVRMWFLSGGKINCLRCMLYQQKLLQVIYLAWNAVSTQILLINPAVGQLLHTMQSSHMQRTVGSIFFSNNITYMYVYSTRHVVLYKQWYICIWSKAL